MEPSARTAFQPERFGGTVIIILERFVGAVGDFIRYVACFNCGRISPEREFCIFCHMPLMIQSPETPEGVHLGCMEDGKAFRLPLECFGFHFAFYGVTGTEKLELQ